MFNERGFCRCDLVAGGGLAHMKAAFPSDMSDESDESDKSDLSEETTLEEES
jgi:hypothetical protein